MNFCKDCKHLNGRPHQSLAFPVRCSLSHHMVTGEPLEAYNARSDEAQCGKDAKWFEPADPAKEDWREPRDKDGYRTE